MSPTNINAATKQNSEFMIDKFEAVRNKSLIEVKWLNIGRNCIKETVLISWWGRGEACTGFWWGNLRERDHLGDPGTDGRIIL
jgi:hypothetical protein